jgi:hypothetical protein
MVIITISFIARFYSWPDLISNCLVHGAQAFLLVNGHIKSKDCMNKISEVTAGPSSLLDWLEFWKSMIHLDPDHSFNFDYFVAWGAKYGPRIYAGEVGI